MVADMLVCEQTKGQSVYQHGVSVRTHFFDLLDRIDSKDFSDWKILDCIDKYGEKIVSNLHDHRVISEYTLHHDCGKPYCKIEDEEGRLHFPDHASVSEQVWLSVGGCPVVGRLIGKDMDLHTISSEELDTKLSEWPIEDVCTLLLVALSEIHSNSKMFGGISSNSFKSKWKKLNRRGNQICRKLFD